MKLFQCANGVLINPSLVTTCLVYKTSGDRHTARFCFVGTAEDIVFNSKSYAEGEIKAFRKHFEEN